MKDNLNDLRAFITVARTGSFTKAGTVLGVSQSALSHSIRGLENRLNIKLFYRSTRSIATTQAGEQLYQRLVPLFDSITQEIEQLSSFRDTLTGTLRINGNHHALHHVLADKLLRFKQNYPEVALELSADDSFVDIIAERFDAGIRLGSDVARDMIAVRVSPDVQMVCVASPEYLIRCGTPSTPYDLPQHECLLHRLSHGGVLTWQFADPATGKSVNVQPHGTLSTNGVLLPKYAAAGLGVLWTPLDTVQDELSAGRLVRLMPDWEMSYEGYHLYYPDRRHHTPLFGALVQGLRE